MVEMMVKGEEKRVKKSHSCLLHDRLTIFLFFDEDKFQDVGKLQFVAYVSRSIPARAPERVVISRDWGLHTEEGRGGLLGGHVDYP